MAQEREPVIQVKNLYKIYRVGRNKVRALNGVDLEIYRGEFCSIVGTSGSGKSTMLNMLAGLEKPTKGEVIISGEHLERMNENQLVKFRREHVGFIFQSFNLLGTMNAKENVALNQTREDICVLNYENQYTRAFGARCPARWGFASTRPTGPMKCPEDSSSVWAWPERWWWTRRLFLPMSRRVIWIPIPRRR